MSPLLRPVPPAVSRSVVGLAIAAAGFYFLRVEMAAPPAHSAHVYVFAGMIGLGCLVAAPDLVLGPLGRLVALAGPLLPRVTLGGGAPKGDA